ncbi:unnamed protein product [Parascedosporium putredinis]|uniref:WDR59/RTC1-like RING zinc finger domain-containing protein n=1 Tax=Parascedosporium putredinis TaxID=1442378 RepID=A0A9P1GVF9_9PEZI|nr:unnamed protein product [Parascedosporium putredinis]CAI7988071.1 unnamed protein product [Parascedosporium putredinis]
MPIPAPPPTCGARFSRDGRLVCFFPTKEEKLRLLFPRPDGIIAKDRPKGIGTGTGTGTSRKRISKPKCILAIHDLRDELPSKKEFAQEYLIFGDGAKVCSHNAKVAQKYGRRDLVDIWNYSALLLRKGIPLELISHDAGCESVLVIARDVMTRLHEMEGEDGLAPQPDNESAMAFVKDLFTYFEHQADVQMLAMLSCIFSEAPSEDSVAYIESRITQPETPLPLKAPSFSLDYFPADASSIIAFHHGRSQTNSVIHTPRTIHTPVRYSGSQLSDDGLWTGEPGSNSYSCGETPPTKGGRDYLGELDQTQSLSSSPNTRSFRRINSGLASSIAANFSRPFATVNSVSSSPPNQGIRGTARTSMSDDDFREELLPLVPISVAVKVEDQTIFDDDGWLVLPLLDPTQSAMHTCYRYAYAEMLHMWEQPLARLEVMKFNVLKGSNSALHNGGGSNIDAASHASFATAIEAGPSSNAHVRPTSPILLGKKEQLHALMTSGRGLDVTGVCLIHETQLEPLEYTSSTEPHMGGAVGSCHRCRRPQKQLLCVYCLEPVDALYPPCLSCGCASHESCLAEWHAAGEVMCPAGDECNCVEEASHGQVETWAAIMGAVGRQKKRRSSALAALGTMLSPTETYHSDGEDDRRSSGAGAGNSGWENVGSAAGIPSRPHGSITSPAKLSLGNRLKKSAGDWGRGSQLRRNTAGPGSQGRGGGGNPRRKGG